ncbi:MAG: ATP-binding protein [Acidobacteriota bacterium]
MAHFILNVDDYAPGRYSRTKILTQAGFEVKEAATGTEALRIAEEMPQLVLLDVNLPDIDGFEVCRRIKQNPKTAGTIVVHLSASSLQPEHFVAGLDGGADSYLTEPIPPAVLIATIRALLRAHSAEEALRYSNSQLDQFANMVSHELREPLRGFTVHVELLKAKLAGRLDVSEQDLVTKALSNARRMNQRINSLLDYSRAEHGYAEIKETSAQEALTECLEELQLLLAETGATVHSGSLPKVQANPTGLIRVFANLITNSVKYRGPEAPEITVSATPRDGGFLFAVRDNGRGIDPQYQGKIFEAFERLHSAEISGAGLGLPLCRRVIHTCGGKIWVESALGEGSTFYFTLPAKASRRQGA